MLDWQLPVLSHSTPCRCLATPESYQRQSSTHILNLMEDILEYEVFIRDQPVAQAVLQMSMEQLMVHGADQWELSKQQVMDIDEYKLSEQQLQLLDQIPIKSRKVYNRVLWWAYLQGELLSGCFL
jgi:hypothetical protein